MLICLLIALLFSGAAPAGSGKVWERDRYPRTGRVCFKNYHRAAQFAEEPGDGAVVGWGVVVGRDGCDLVIGWPGSQTLILTPKVDFGRCELNEQILWIVNPGLWIVFLHAFWSQVAGVDAGGA